MEKELRFWFRILAGLFVCVFLVIGTSVLYLTFQKTKDVEDMTTQRAFMAVEQLKQSLVEQTLDEAICKGRPFNDCSKGDLIRYVDKLYKDYDYQESFKGFRPKEQLSRLCTELCKCAEAENSTEITPEVFKRIADSH